MSKSPASWVDRGKQLLDIRIDGLRDQTFGEDCLRCLLRWIGCGSIAICGEHALRAPSFGTTSRS